MKVQVTDQSFDPWRMVSDHNASQPGLKNKAGATTVFVGCMRDFNHGESVKAMTLEHYPAMTAVYLEKLCNEAEARWPLLDTLVVHRFGELKPSDPIVLVAVWSTHRDDAFAACRYLIDELKTRAPFWKQEQTDIGTRWVVPQE